MEREARPSRVEYYMGHAKQAATRATCSRLQVGAVVVRDDAIVSTGYNGSPRGLSHCDHSDGIDSSCTSVVHAELNAVVHAGRGLCMGSEMFITHAPCLACSGAIINSGLARVTFQSYYKNEDGLDRLHQAGISIRHRPELSSAMRVSEDEGTIHRPHPYL